MNLNEYQALFATRKWKLAMAFAPLDTPIEVKVKRVGDLLTIRTRASEFSKNSEDKKVSVSLNFEEKVATVTVTKKNQ